MPWEPWYFVYLACLLFALWIAPVWEEPGKN